MTANGAELRSYLTLRKAEDIAQGKETEWLFPSQTGTLLDESYLVRAFHRVLDAAGLPRYRVYDSSTMRDGFQAGKFTG